MMELKTVIATARRSVVAIMKVHPNGKKDGAGNLQFDVGIVGTAFCVVSNKSYVTAHHVLNGGKPREAGDKFFVFRSQQRVGTIAHFPITHFHLEDAASDIAIFDAATPPGVGIDITSLPVCDGLQEDGTAVLTYGFPAPLVMAGSLDLTGNWVGGKVMIVGNANIGIVAGSELDAATNNLIYHFNVGWHNGESGGPVALLDPLAVIAIMQANRDIVTQRGDTVRGPRIGRALSWVKAYLQAVGASFVPPSQRS
jgi:Trypsin-like peptidase domain